MIRRGTRLAVTAVALFAGAMGGCASSSVHETAKAPARAPVIVKGDTGAAASWDEVISSTSGSEVVIIGENHGHPLGLATASKIWTDTLARADKATLSMEFLERDEQSHIDDYLAGLVDEKTFKASTGRTEGNYPPGHREMVETAKAGKRPVIASNAPRPQVRAASKDGYDKLRTLTPEQQRLVRIPDAIPTGRYYDDFVKVMSDPAAAHGPPPKTEEERQQAIEKAFRSQSLWDWTMADSVVKATSAGGTPVCHVVGRFHCDFQGGLVQAVQKLRPGTRVVVVSFVDDWSDTLREEDRGRGDYVIYVGPAPQ